MNRDEASEETAYIHEYNSAVNIDPWSLAH